MKKQEINTSGFEHQEELDNLYSSAIEIGYSPKEAQEFCMIRLKHLMHCSDYGDPSEEVDMLHKIEKAYIEGYDTLEEDHRNKLLWSIGFNTSKPIWENVLIYVEGYRKKIGLFICGTERIDWEWTDPKKSPASFEARVRKANDLSLTKELDKLANGRASYT